MKFPLRSIQKAGLPLSWQEIRLRRCNDAGRKLTGCQCAA